MQVIRIFISSPGDVQEERDRARSVVHQLRRRYAGRLDLQALLWEELPLQADMSFQQGIDVVLSETGVDIAIFILWSRLGSPTGPLIVGENGKLYRSGTEREWDLMLNARERCRREGSAPRPSIIVYTRKDDVSFDERLRGKSVDEQEREVQQKKMVGEFIREEFRDANTGVNLRAYHSFDHPTTFAQQLRIHLTALLDPLAGDDLDEPVWDIAANGPPFRGLDVFEVEHAPVFFGREDEIVTIRTRLREQACRGCAFVLISGASGSGKSSLARAGVLPDICNFETDKDLRSWRSLAVKPSQLSSDLVTGLIVALSEKKVLPELSEWSNELLPCQNDPSLWPKWLVRVVLRIGDALKATGHRVGASRLLLLVDQLEELYSDTSISAESREQFLELLETLARSGYVWVLATVRSDFLQHCQTSSALVRMKDGSGQYDLMPPAADAMLRIISGPAAMAGLRFERQGEQSLADVIMREAAEHRELLPLVEHLLLELCLHRSADGMLTFAQFHRLGGVEGALRKRCEDTFAALSPAARSSLDSVLSELVALSGNIRENCVRRTVPSDRLCADPSRAELVRAMVAARLFTSTGGSKGRIGSAVDGEATGVVSVSHEALLRVWPRAAEWINNNREFLRLRTAIEHACARWQLRQQDSSLLLPSGLPLEEGRRLVILGGQRLDDELRQFVDQSVQAEELRANRARKRRRATISILSITTAVIAMLGIYAWQQADEARTALKQVEQQQNIIMAERNQANEARERETLAKEAANQAKQKAESAARELEKSLARSNYLLAVKRWEEGRVREARQLLCRIPPEYRNVEWHFHNRLFDGGDITLYGHLGSINDVEISPDGTRIASASGDNSIKIWDAASGEELHSLEGHSDSVYQVVFSPDGARIVSASDDSCIKLWDVASGVDLRALEDRFVNVNPVVFSPDGTRIALMSSDGTIILCDAHNGEELHTLVGHTGLVTCAAFSPDGKCLALAREDTCIQIWDSAGGELLKTLEGHSGNVKSVAFSPDGKWLASAGEYGGVKLWDAAGGEKLKTLVGHSNDVYQVAFSPDGTRIASVSSDGTIRLWDAAIGEEIRTLAGHSNRISCMAFSPDGEQVVTGSDDNTLKLWDATSGKELRTLAGHTSCVNCVAFSPDGTHVVSGSDDETIKIWDLKCNEEMFELPVRAENENFLLDDMTDGHVMGLGLSEDASEVVWAVEDGLVKRWNSTTGRVVTIQLRPDGPKPIGPASFNRSATQVSVSDIDAMWVFEIASASAIERFSRSNDRDSIQLSAFGPHNDRIAVLTELGNIEIWEIDSGVRLVEKYSGAERFSCLAYSPEGTRIVTGNEDGEVELLDVADLKSRKLGDAHIPIAGAIAISPDGNRIVSGNAEGNIKLWDALSLREIATVSGAINETLVVAFSPDGSRIASGGIDGTIRLWDAHDGQELCLLGRHDSKVEDIVFSLDGSCIATADDDRAIKLWDVSTSGAQTLSGDEEVSDFALSPDGSRLATSSFSTWTLWDANSGAAIKTDYLEATHEGRISQAPTMTRFSRDGAKFIKVFPDGHVELGDSLTGNKLRVFESAAGVKNADFSDDGRHIIAVEHWGGHLAWDVATGQEVSSPAPPVSEAPQRMSLDRRWFATALGSDIRLVDREFELSPRELARRKLHTRTSPEWHLEKALVAEGKTKNAYAALFHRAWVIRSLGEVDPIDGRRFADAPLALVNAHKQWRESIKGSPAGELADPDILLQPRVREILQASPVEPAERN